jgi:hypothetical protein
MIARRSGRLPEAGELLGTTARGPDVGGWASVEACSFQQNSAGTVGSEMSKEPFEPKHDDDRELPVEELLRRARPMPPHAEMAIVDLTSEEGEAFLDAVHG